MVCCKVPINPPPPTLSCDSRNHGHHFMRVGGGGVSCRCGVLDARASISRLQSRSSAWTAGDRRSRPWIPQKQLQVGEEPSPPGRDGTMLRRIPMRRSRLRKEVRRCFGGKSANPARTLRIREEGSETVRRRVSVIHPRTRFLDVYDVFPLQIFLRELGS